MIRIDDYDMTGLASLVSKGETTPNELLNACLQRVEERNPALTAVTVLAKDAAHARIDAGLPNGPFHGVPFLLKDSGAEATDIPSNEGSRLYANTQWPVNSVLYDRLVATGLVPFGRCAAPEHSVGIATEAAVYGAPTRNPWNPDHTPGGSSGGSAAAVAAGMAPGAHGADGGGSIRVPASCCGLFGFKPTRARLPDGPYSGEGWAGMAIEGFLTRSVRDTARLLDATHGPDLGQPYAAPPLPMSFAQSLDTAPGKLNIALCDTSFTGAEIHPECRAAVHDAAQLLENMGHEVTPARPNAHHQTMLEAWTDIVACGVALSVRKELQALGRPLADDDLEPISRSAVAHAATISGDAYLEAVSTIHRYGRQMAAFFADWDILLTPTLAEPPARIGRFNHQADDYLDFRLGPERCFDYSPYCAAFNASGQPAMSVPLAWSESGLPIGIHLAARFGDDARLMSLAADLERARPWFCKRPQ